MVISRFSQAPQLLSVGRSNRTHGAVVGEIYIRTDGEISRQQQDLENVNWMRTFLNCDNFLLHQSIVEGSVHIEEAFLRLFDVADLSVEKGDEVVVLLLYERFECIGMVVNAENFWDSIA